MAYIAVFPISAAGVEKEASHTHILHYALLIVHNFFYFCKTGAIVTCSLKAT